VFNFFTFHAFINVALVSRRCSCWNPVHSLCGTCVKTICTPSLYSRIRYFAATGKIFLVVSALGFSRLNRIECWKLTGVSGNVAVAYIKLENRPTITY
jgi:hypothetical protein